MKRTTFFAALLLCLSLLADVAAFSQNYQSIPNYGQTHKRIKVLNTLTIPSGDALPTTPDGDTGPGALFFETTLGKLHVWTGSGWIIAAGGGGGGGADALADLSDVTLNALADGNFLRYNGAAWVNTLLTVSDIPTLPLEKIAGFPSLAGNAGKFLTTDGSALSWGSPSLSGYVPTSRTLTINGTTFDLSANRSWTIPNELPSQTGHAGKVLSTNGSAVSWIPLPSFGGDIGNLQQVTDIGATTSKAITVGGLASDGDVYSDGNFYTPNTLHTNDISLGYGAGFSGSVTLGSLTANRSYTLPNKDGTVALLSDIPSLSGYLLSSTAAATYQPLGSYVPTARTLTINGTAFDLSADRSWTISTPDPLPSQTGNAGKFLQTNGTAASWQTINLDAAYNGARQITRQAPGLEGVTPGGATVGEFLDAVFYPSQAPTAGLSLTYAGNTAGGFTLEMMAAGANLSGTLNWSAGRQASTAALQSVMVDGAAQTFTPPAAGASVSGTKAASFARNASSSFSMTVTTTDGKSASASASVSFAWKRYYGFVSTGTPDDATIRALTNEFATGRTRGTTSPLTPTGAQKFVIAFPESLDASGLSQIWIAGLNQTGAFDRTTRSFTNASGGTTSYIFYIYKNQTSGAIAFEIK